MEAEMAWVKAHPGLTALIVVGIIVTIYVIGVVIFNAGGSITDDGLGESITESAAFLR
jgi:hypothetical protein